MSGNRGSFRKGYYKTRNDRPKGSVGEKEKKGDEVDENSPVMQMFRQYSAELDAKHDRHERIVKVGRDITIESKRIIFLLHSYGTDLDHKKEQIYKDAEMRLNQLCEKNFKLIAQELDGQDPYLYLRAYSSGLQEFIEAFLYYQYLTQGSIQPCNVINEKLHYSAVENADEDSDIESCNRKITVEIPLSEYFLGLADFTGELMRRCINNLGSGSIDDCFKVCNYVKDIYTGFLGINNIGYKELGRKAYVLRQSLLKMEYVCYTIQVRGNEIPKHMLANVIAANSNPDVNDKDEGYY